MAAQPGADQPTFHRAQWAAEARLCPTCGALQTDDDRQRCQGCQRMLELQQEFGWTFEQLAEEMAAQRQTALRMQAEELAQVAGKSDQQLALEEEIAKQHRQVIEPPIDTPDCLMNGLAPEARSPEEQAQIRTYLADKKYALPNTVPEAPTLAEIPGTVCQQDGQLSDGWLVKPVGRAVLVGVPIGAEIRWTLSYPLLNIVQLTVRGPEQSERRVTKPRMAAFGLFAMAAKKEYRHAYFVLEACDQPPLVYRVDGLNVIELEAHLSPLLRWFEQHRADLAELRQLWRQ